MSENYIKERVQKEPHLKEFGGLAPEMMSDEPDLHIKESEKYTLVKERVSYYDVKYDIDIGKRAQKAIELFAFHFGSFWD
jgi:hypothetical protein